MADALYHGFRCGLIHSGIILEYGRINEKYKDVIKPVPWLTDKAKIDIHVNPPLLLMELKKAFKQYVHKLRYSKDVDLKDNFKKKI